ncbi:MAG: PstS family phosphate ABC transporter substrate-binding protein [Bacteroidota bacterium]
MKLHMSHVAALVLVLLATSYCGAPQREGMIQVKGSDTEVNLALALAETYMADNEQASIAVTGGGSGTGIAALINGKTDIANSSREIGREELDMAKERGIDPKAIIFAQDGLALVVHPSLPIDSLSLDQLAAIFSGEVTHWSELGGPNKEISVYGRQSNSGTYLYFRDEIVKGEYGSGTKAMNGTAQIVEAIKQDPAAIGYVGIGYIADKNGVLSPGLKALSICPNDTSVAVSPLKKSAIQDGSYPITRPLYQYTNGKPTGTLLAFILYELGEEGQRIVAENGYYEINEAHKQHNASILDTLP